MQQNKQPLIIVSIIAAVILILGLAWIFSRDNTDTPEPVAEQRQEQTPPPSASETLLNEGEAIIAGLQASAQRLISAAEACDMEAFDAEQPIIEDLAVRSQKLTAEIEKADAAPPELLSLPETIRQEILKGLGASQAILACQPGRLPGGWDDLTPRQKTDLNPFDCDHATQWVSADDGRCIDKPAD